MRWVSVWLVVLSFSGCVNARHAQVNLANNPNGADCFARCTSAATTSDQTVNCVAACPGARRADSDCDGQQVCVDHRVISTAKSTLLLLGGAAVVFVLAGRAGG